MQWYGIFPEMISHVEAETQWPSLWRRHFEMHVSILIKKNSLKFVLWGPINNISTLVKKMAWCRLDDTPLSEPMTVSFHTHICVTRPQWIKYIMRIIDGWPFYCVDASMKLIQWRHTSSMVSPITPILNCLFSSLSRIATKETSTLRITGSARV